MFFLSREVVLCSTDVDSSNVYWLCIWLKVCVAGVGLVGDLCRNLSSIITPYANNLVKALVDNLTVS